MGAGFILRWTAGTALGLGGGLVFTYAAARFLGSIHLPWYAIGAAMGVFFLGTLPGATIGLAQGLVLRERVPAWRWVLATSIGGGLGLVALGVVFVVLGGIHIPIVEFASAHSTRFGTGHAISDVSIRPLVGNAPTFNLSLGVVEQAVLGGFWAVVGGVLGALLGLAQRGLLRRRGWRTAWVLWSALGLGGGLMLGMGIHGLIRDLSGTNTWFLWRNDFWTWSALATAMAVTGTAYGVASGLALRRTLPGPGR